MILEGREAWSDHCLHAERVHTDRRRYTFIVAPRHKGFQQEHNHWRVAGRHDSHHGLCEHATSSSARDRAIRDDRKISAQRVVARHSDHEKLVDDD